MMIITVRTGLGAQICVFSVNHCQQVHQVDYIKLNSYVLNKMVSRKCKVDYNLTSFKLLGNWFRPIEFTKEKWIG